MLVLSRQRDETIMIGDNVEITVVDIRGDKVRLGISAPTSIAVHRKEVYEAIKQENQRAAKIAAPDIDTIKPPARPAGSPRAGPDARPSTATSATRTAGAKPNDSQGRARTA